MRQAWVATAAVLVAVCFGGCSAPDPGESIGEDELGTGQVERLTRDQEAVLVAEYEDRLVACLEDAGIGVKVATDGGGGWELDWGGMDDDAFWALEARCREAIGEPSSAPITAAEAAGLYDLNLEMKACLEALGVTVLEPPSKQDYVDDYLAGVAPWSPYDAGVAQQQFEESCPQPGLEDLE